MRGRSVSLSAARDAVANRIKSRRQREQVLKQRGITPKRLLKQRKDRLEAMRIKLVRALCVTRDGSCRIVAWQLCGGPSEWAHFGDRRRAHTRGMAPEARHTTEGTLMLCRRHHDQYDKGHLTITALTDKGCDGKLEFLL